MSPQKKKLFVLGATGFIGQQVAHTAIQQGWNVTAVVRNLEKASHLIHAGVRVLKGDAALPSEWIGSAAGCDVLVDLVQPKLPARIGKKEIAQITQERLEVTRRLLAALKSIPPNQRPRLFSVSGLDDLTPDANGVVSEESSLRTEPSGFAHIGVPVRRAIQDAAIDSTFIYLGVVYGPGKAFAETIFPKLAAGRFRYPGNGDNRVPLVHVADAARAIVHLADLQPEVIAHRSIIVADGHAGTMNQFLGCAAQLLQAKHPSTAPRWIAQLLIGEVMWQALTRNIAANPTTLLKTEFQFNYPTYRQGLPPTLEQLGYSIHAAPSSNANPKKSANSVALAIFLPLAIAGIIAVNSFNLPYSAHEIQHYSKCLPLLDMRLHYNDRDVYRLFDALGPAGRQINLRFYWTWDLALPFLFGSSLWLLIRRTRLSKLRWLAPLAAALDYAENICISILLLLSTQRLTILADLASWFTTAKWVAYSCAMFLAIVGSMDMLFFKNRREQVRLPR